MDQDNIRLELGQQIADACKSGDINKLIHVLGTVSLKAESDIAIRLRALELQIRLADLYEANYRYLQTLSAASQVPTLSGANGDDEAQTIQKLNNIRETLEGFLKNFSQTLKECIKLVTESSVTCDAIVQKLHDQTKADLVMKLLGETDAFHDQEWLSERSAVTQSGVEEGIWGSISAIDEFVADTTHGVKIIIDEISALQDDIQSGLKVALRELVMAAQGLFPGLILGGQDGY